ALLAGPDVDLVAALHLTQDLQGRLNIETTSDERQRFVLVVPAGTASVVAPVSAPGTHATATS
ncbi:MAG: hypothetical protein AAFN30_19080, partial [Actinomycetota bacterium]